jgi:hypothetical protein
MKRTTLFIAADLERELQALARRRGQPVAGLVREAIAQYVTAARESGRPRLGFVASGRSGRRDTADRHEELLFDRSGTAEVVPRRRRTARTAAPGRRRG